MCFFAPCALGVEMIRPVGGDNSWNVTWHTELEYYPSASPAPLAQNWHSPFMASYSSRVRVFISPLWWESQNKCSKWLPTFITAPLKMRSFSQSAQAYFGTTNRSNVQHRSGKILRPLTGEEGRAQIVSSSCHLLPVCIISAWRDEQL